jgi:trigger factor
MITTKEVELQENSSVKLKITVKKKSVKEEYDNLVRKYCQTVQLKGFRKGKVPADVLIRKFGDSLTAETTENIVRGSLEDILESIKHKPLPYSTPTVDSQSSLDLQKDFVYDVLYDTYPEIELSDYLGLEYEELKVKITAEDLKRELKNLQEQNSCFIDKEDGVVEKGDNINIDYVEVDEKGAELPGTKRESFAFIVGSGYNLYQLDDDLLSMKNGEEKVIKKKFGQDFENKELAGRDIELKVKVNNIKEKELPELNDDLAQDISDKYNTLDDLKNDLKQKIEETSKNRVRANSISKLLDQIVDKATIPLPKSMIELELNSQWRSFLGQYNVDEKKLLEQLKQKDNKPKEDMLEQWRPSAERKLKLLLAVNKMIEKEKIKAGKEEIKKEVKKIADSRSIAIKQAEEELKKGNYLEYMKEDLKKEKLYDLLLEKGKAKPGESINFLDLLEGNY